MLKFIRLGKRRTKLLAHQNLVMQELRRKMTRPAVDRFFHALRKADGEGPNAG